MPKAPKRNAPGDSPAKASEDRDIVIRPMTPVLWPDLVRLFGKHGGCAGCWCMYPRLRHRDYVAGKGATNRRRLRALVTRRALHGVLAYVDGVPAAWCSFGPRDSFPSLAKSRILAPVDAAPVWSVVCFYIGRGYRRRGLATRMLEAAAAYAARRGAPVLEGYPHDRSRTPLPDAFAWHGVLTSFRRAGFKEVARRSAGRPIVRRPLQRGAKSVESSG
jgi:GNAT superfamily N-acetyltransferase